MTLCINSLGRVGNLSPRVNIRYSILVSVHRQKERKLKVQHRKYIVMESAKKSHGGPAEVMTVSVNLFNHEQSACFQTGSHSY